MANTKIPVELSSTPGIVDNSDATAITIDSSERVIVGQTAIATGFENFAQLETSHASAGGLVINTQTASTSNYGRLIFTKGNAAGGEGLIRYNTGDYHMSFWTAATQRLRLDSDGLKFGTDTAAANALDDYEEGEWTPAVSGGTSAGTTTHTNQNGYYVKVGELVTVTCFVRYTAATGSGYLKLTGLPYAIGNRTQNYPVAATVIDGLNWGGGTYVQALSVPGLQETNFYYMTDDANATRQNLNNETAAIRFSMTYRI